MFRRELSAPTSVLRFRWPSIRLPWWLLLLVLAGQLVARLALLVVWLLLHLRFTAGLVATFAVVYVFRRWGPPALYVPVGALIAVLAAWLHLAPASFGRWVRNPLTARWRRLTVYRRDWQPAMVTAGLALPSAMGNLLPELRRVERRDGVDVLTVRTNPGQTLEVWTVAAEQLARTFRVLDVRVRTVPGRPELLELACLVRDPLADVVPLAGAADPVDLEAVPVALREDGSRFDLRLLYSHVLVAGETGSGKGSVLWSLLVGIAPAIRSGLVRVWAIDPKGGLELAAGAPLFSRFAYGGPTATGAPWQEAIAELLEDRVRGMQTRAARLRGTTRKLEPSLTDPVVLIVIDELASLTAYITDAALRRRIADALGLLLSQGRAVGFVVVAATQDARKETLPMRDLFPTRIALRTAEAEQADLILGRGAHARGARTDRISEALPGVGYVVVDDTPAPVRVRFAHVTDATIAAVADEYRPAPATLPPLTVR